MTGIVRRILASSRYFIVVAVVGSFIASAAALVYGGLAGRVLARAGIVFADVSADIVAIIGRGESPPTTERVMAPRLRIVLGLAVAEAARLDHGFVGTGHLLLGLVREAQGIAARILTGRRADLEDLTAATLRALTTGDTPLAET